MWVLIKTLRPTLHDRATVQHIIRTNWLIFSGIPVPILLRGDFPKHWHFNKSLLDVVEDVEAEVVEAQAGEMDNCT